MSSAIVTFPGGAAIAKREPRIKTDTTYWRRKARDFGVAGVHICLKCEDTGMVPVLVVDEVEWDICTRCSHHWGPMSDYPTEDDVAVEVEF